MPFLVKNHILFCDCGRKGIRNEQWDSYYCEACNKWLEPKCTPHPEEPFEGCAFHCWDRPEKPNP
jgi:hypothetical protein